MQARMTASMHAASVVAPRGRPRSAAERITTAGFAGVAPGHSGSDPRRMSAGELDIDPAVLAHMLTGNVASWQAEIPQIEEHYQMLGSTVPDELREQLRELAKRLGR